MEFSRRDGIFATNTTAHTDTLLSPIVQVQGEEGKWQESQRRRLSSSNLLSAFDASKSGQCRGLGPFRNMNSYHISKQQTNFSPRFLSILKGNCVLEVGSWVHFHNGKKTLNHYNEAEKTHRTLQFTRHLKIVQLSNIYREGRRRRKRVGVVLTLFLSFSPSLFSLGWPLLCILLPKKLCSSTTKERKTFNVSLAKMLSSWRKKRSSFGGLYDSMQ